MMHRILAVWLMCLPAFGIAQESPSFRWTREIVLPDIKETTLVSVALDSLFFDRTRDGWPDVRLRNDQGQSVGFVIHPAREFNSQMIRSTWTAEQSAAKIDAAEGLQLTLSLRDKEPRPTGIRIVTPLKDFEHQVRLETSPDGVIWTSAEPPTVIFDYSRHVDARNDLVPFTAGSNRHFRITVEELSAEQESQLMELHRRLEGSEEKDRMERTVIARRPFRIDRVEFYRNDLTVKDGKPRITSYQADKVAVVENEADHQTVVTFSTHREPITEIKVITPSENFSRTTKVEAELEDANGQATWRALATGTISRFAVGTVQTDERILTIPKTQASNYRVVIENRDSPRLTKLDIALSGPTYELTFLATPAQALHLEYGSSDAPAGKFDIAALQAAMSQHQSMTTAKFRPPQANADAPVPSASWKPWNDARVQIGVIIAVTALLGWGLYQAGTRIKPPEA